MNRRHLTRWLVAAAIVAAVPAIATVKLSKDGATRLQLSELDGVWRSRGYGWVWSAENGAFSQYDESGDFCIKSRGWGPDSNEWDATFEYGDDGKTIDVSVKDDSYVYRFDRIDALPEACRAEPRSDPVAIFDAAVATLRSHYAFFEARKVDWEAAVRTARGRVAAGMTKRQLFAVLSQLLSHFPDSHVGLAARIDGERRHYYPSDSPSYHARGVENPHGTARAKVDPDLYWAPRAAGRLLDDGARTDADGDITYGLIDGDVGYLRIDSMSGYSASRADRAMERAMDMFGGARAVIVDVSGNGGGQDRISRQIAKHFASERTVGYYKYPGDSETDEPPQPIHVEASGPARYTGPVILVTSRRTVSAAEVFVLAMRALPNVTHVGETTDGSLSDVLTKVLPGGWALELSNEVYLDSKGRSWEGYGIAPEIDVRVDSERRASDRDVEAARRLVDHLLSLLPSSRTRNRT